MSNTTFILIYLAAALVISRLPFLRVYFSLCNTLMEEIFHVCACVVSKDGSSSKIKLFKDGSGQSTGNVHSKILRAILGYIGFTCTLFIAIGLFYLVSISNYELIIYLFIGLLVISIILWIRNGFGILWALSFIVMLALPLYYRFEMIVMHAALFLSSMILVQSVINALKIVGHSFKGGESFSPKTVLAKIQAFFRGMVLLSQSFLAAYIIFYNVLDVKTSMVRFELLEIIEVMEKVVT